MSNPLEKKDDPSNIEPIYDDPDGLEIGTIEDMEWIQDLLRKDRTRSGSLSYQRERTAPEKIHERRLSLFETGSKFAPVMRDEIVGIDNVLSQIDEVLDYLIHYKDYARFGARPEPGIIFEGQPGTGKTYTSRYMATMADALFVDVRDFPYSGRTLAAQDVKVLYDLARSAHQKTKKPVILFWDEFEGATTERGSASIEAKSVVSQITSELDGINGKPAGVLLIGCTNYGNDIDQALRRPGRMGLHVQFNSPSRIGKSKLLKLYISKVKSKGEIDFDTASYFFDDSDTAASVEEAVHQVWRFAVHRWIQEGKPRGGPVLTQPDLLEIFLKRLVGPPPAYSEVTPETHYRIAVHETGHALAAILLDVGLRLVTIRPGTEHLGKTMTYLRDPRTSTLDELNNHLKVGVAGFVVEDITGIPRGASSEGDTKAVTELAMDLVDSQGFGKETGFFNLHAARKRYYDIGGAAVSGRTLDNSDLDVQGLISQAEKEVRELLLEFGIDNIKLLVDKLVEVQTMTGKDFEKEVRAIGGH